MPEPITANYVAEMQVTGKHLRLCVTSTLEGDIVAKVYDIEEAFSVYMRDTKKTSSDSQETRTTVYLGDGNSGFLPSR